MTGEITLRGAVSAIGGLKEKLLAARQAGITRVLIPKENEGDLKELPKVIEESMQIIPVETVEDVLRHALGISLKQLAYSFQRLHPEPKESMENRTKEAERAAHSLPIL